MANTYQGGIGGEGEGRDGTNKKLLLKTASECYNLENMGHYMRVKEERLAAMRLKRGGGDRRESSMV
jgi:hypothetical protein